MKRLAVMLAALAASCGSHRCPETADDGATDDTPDEVVLDTTDDHEPETRPGGCWFLPDPIEMWVEGFDCSLVDEMAEGEHRTRNVHGSIDSFVMSTEESYFLLAVGPGELVRVNFSGFYYSDAIVHNLNPGDEIDIQAVVYKNRKCITGMRIYKPCAFSGSVVIHARNGDAENPLYPEWESYPYFDIEVQEGRCTHAIDPPPHCDVDDVYRLSFLFATGVELVLEQGTVGITPVEGAGQSYRVMNRYSYHSPDCGGDVFSYFVQMWDPAWLCGM